MRQARRWLVTAALLLTAALLPTLAHAQAPKKPAPGAGTKPPTAPAGGGTSPQSADDDAPKTPDPKAGDPAAPGGSDATPSGGDVDICQITPDVLVSVVSLLESHPLRAMDALHVACALAVKPDVFVSADRRQLFGSAQGGAQDN